MLRNLSLALRNLARYKTRTAITVIAVLVSVLVSTVVDGFIRGIFNMSTYNLLSYESAEVTIYENGYFEKRNEYPSDHLISASELHEAEERLERAGIRYSPRYKTAADIIFYKEEEDSEFDLNALLVGLDPEKDSRVFRLSSSVSEGSWLERGADGIVIGSRIAEKLGLSVGSLVTLSTTGRGGFAETLDEEVIGILNSENPAVNGSEVFMSLDVLDDYLFLDGAVSEISVTDGRASDPSPAVQKRTSRILENSTLEAYYYEAVNDDLMAIMNGDKGSSYLILIFLFIIAASGISNTMIMAALERQKESAMLRSLGFSRRNITSMFVLEGVIAGAIGAIIGTAAAAAVLYPLSRNGIDITAWVSSDADFGYRVPLVLRSGMYWQSFLIIPSLAVILSGLSAFFPVFRSGREEIAELFRRA